MVDNPDGQDFPEENSIQENESFEKKRWMVAAITIVSIILLGILAYILLSSSGFFGKRGAFITITEPIQGSVINTESPVVVSGLVGGLFEGNVIIQALDDEGDVLVQQPTTISAPDTGTIGEGSWSVEVVIDSIPGTQGRIVTFLTSPEDDSTIAADSLDVTFGEAISVGEQVDLEEHLWMLDRMNREPLVANTFINLQFENFRAHGSGGCNRYFTSYEYRGSQLNFGLVTSTAKSCEIPFGIMAQEEEYFASMEQAAAFTNQNKQMKVFNSSNDLLLVYNSVVMGFIKTKEATELPEDAVVHIRLEDVSIAETEAKLVAEQVLADVTEFPIPFMVTYDAQEIREKNTYAIGVRIEDRSGNLLFTNTTAFPVITGGNQSILEVTVEAVQ